MNTLEEVYKELLFFYFTHFGNAHNETIFLESRVANSGPGSKPESKQILLLKSTDIRDSGRGAGIPDFGRLENGGGIY